MTINSNSAQPCGCDPGVPRTCDRCTIRILLKKVETLTKQREYNATLAIDMESDCDHAREELASWKHTAQRLAVEATADLNVLRDELVTLKANYEAACSDRDELSTIYANLKADVERLLSYVQHKKDCALWTFGMARKCTCGLEVPNV